MFGKWTKAWCTGTSSPTLPFLMKPDDKKLDRKGGGPSPWKQVTTHFQRGACIALIHFEAESLNGKWQDWAAWPPPPHHHHHHHQLIGGVWGWSNPGENSPSFFRGEGVSEYEILPLVADWLVWCGLVTMPRLGGPGMKWKDILITVPLVWARLGDWTDLHLIWVDLKPWVVNFPAALAPPPHPHYKGCTGHAGARGGVLTLASGNRWPDTGRKSAWPHPIPPGVGG